MGDLVGKRREGRMPCAPHAPLGRQLQVEADKGGAAGAEPSKLAQLFGREQPIGGLLNARANIVDDAFAQFGSKGVMHVDGNRGGLHFHFLRVATASRVHPSRQSCDWRSEGIRKPEAISAKVRPWTRRSTSTCRASGERPGMSRSSRSRANAGCESPLRISPQRTISSGWNLFQNDSSSS